MKCPDCGFENMENAAYCEECGSKLFASSESSSVAEQVPPPVEPQQKEEPESTAKVYIEDIFIKLSREVNTIGRRSPADGIYPDIDLTDYDPDSYVSRRHAQILKEGFVYSFEDMGSSNGSFINEERMRKGVRRELKDKDIIRLGRTEVLFSLD